MAVRLSHGHGIELDRSESSHDRGAIAPAEHTPVDVGPVNGHGFGMSVLISDNNLLFRRESFRNGFHDAVHGERLVAGCRSPVQNDDDETVCGWCEINGMDTV